MNPLIIHIQNQIARCDALGMWVLAEFWRKELVNLLTDLGINSAVELVWNMPERSEVYV